MANEKKKKKLKGIHPSAIKRARQTVKRSKRTSALRTQMRTQIKALRTLFDAKDKNGSESQLKKTLPVIAKMVSKGILHHRTAARYTSRLQKHFNKI